MAQFFDNFETLVDDEVLVEHLVDGAAVVYFRRHGMRMEVWREEIKAKEVVRKED